MGLEKHLGDSGYARPVYTYTIPESLRDESNGTPAFQTVGMRALSSEQELMASKLGRYELQRAQYAAVKLSIAEFDGKTANYADGEVDKFWDRCSPKLRSLLLQTYNKLTSPSREEEDSFFGSETVKV